MQLNLVRKYVGIFNIFAKVIQISYKLELLPYIKVHPTFHTSVLKSYHKEKDDPSQG